MKWFAVAIPLLCLLVAAPALAETPSSTDVKFNTTISPGELTPTPEMWFYEQYLRQQQDPKAGVRQKAEFRMSQRQDRIAARRWFGFSNARPVAGSDPYHGEYSPTWASNNSHYPYRWSGVNGASVIVRPSGE